MLCGFTPFWDSGSPLKIYENILKGRVKYPPYIHPDAQDLLGKLITHDLTKRLGNLHGGSRDVMTHPWFAEVTWERLARKDIDAPYVPPVKGGVGDASLFDKYPEETEAYGNAGDDAYVALISSLVVMWQVANMMVAGMASSSPTSRPVLPGFLRQLPHTWQSQMLHIEQNAQCTVWICAVRGARERSERGRRGRWRVRMGDVLGRRGDHCTPQDMSCRRNLFGKRI